MITTPSTQDLPKKALAYVRVSSEKQKDNASPNAQKEKILEYARANNVEIVEWFEDIAKSAKNANREGLQNLVKYALRSRGQIDYVIVYKMSRASRDAESFFVDIVRKLHPRGIRIRSATETFDESPGGKFMQLLHLGMAEFDNGIKSEYTKDVMQSLARQGYYQHPPILGYSACKVKNSEGKRRPSILTRYAESLGLKSVNGKVIGKESIHRMLMNATYAGYIQDCHTNFEVVEGKHEAIISKDIYRTNQGLILGKKNRLGEPRLKKNQRFVLKGTIRCMECNKVMYASAPKTGNGGHSPRYFCGNCKRPSISARLVHEDFEEMLKHIKPTEGTLKLYKEILIREANNQLGRLNTEVELYRDQLNDVAKKRVDAIEKFTMGDLTKEEKNEFVDALEIRKLDTEAKLRDLEDIQSLRENEIEYAITFMEMVDRQWVDADFDLKQKFQNMLFPSGLVYDVQNRQFGTSEISALYRSGDTKNDPEGSLKFHLVAGRGFEPLTSWL